MEEIKDIEKIRESVKSLSISKNDIESINEGLLRIGEFFKNEKYADAIKNFLTHRNEMVHNPSIEFDPTYSEYIEPKLVELKMIFNDQNIGEKIKNVFANHDKNNVQFNELFALNENLNNDLIIIQNILPKLEPKNLKELEDFRINWIGTKSHFKTVFENKIKSIPNDQKKLFGQTLNETKQKAEELFQHYQEQLASTGASSGEMPDLSLPETPSPIGSRHPVSIVMEEIIDVFARMGFEVAEDREIEDDWHNFTAMNTPEDHPARDMQDTYYVASPPGWLLRTHTSSVQARVMTTRKPPIRIIAPGRVYRNETVSARSHCQFHQVEVLYVDEGVSFADMKQTLHQFAQAMYGKDVVTRLRPSYFPFTEPSAEMDVYYGLADEHAYRITKGTGWLEIMGCGMVDPAVLETCGIDSTKYSGFACGMGIERQAMIKYRINDIRLLFENDVRFLKQFASVV